MKAYVSAGPSDPRVFSASLFASLLCCQRNSFPLKYRQTSKHKNSMSAKKEKINFIGENNQRMIHSRDVHFSCSINKHVCLSYFFWKKQKNFNSFPNVYACFLKTGRLIGSELIQAKAPEF